MRRGLVVAAFCFLLLSAGCMERQPYSIQKTVENATDGETIYVPSGTYHESVVINKSVKLIASGSVKIVPKGTFAIKICADNVTIEGFNITSGGKENVFGIEIEGNGSLIENNSIFSCAYGIYVKHGFGKAKISHNILFNNKYGIYILSESRHNEIFENNFSNNNYGVRIKGKENKVYRNVFYENNLGVFLCCKSGNNIVYMNNFIDNAVHADDDRYTNNWSYNGKGNYWDNYKGTDENGDGIGDEPYHIIGTGHREDEYPLMEPVNVSIR